MLPFRVLLPRVSRPGSGAIACANYSLRILKNANLQMRIRSRRQALLPGHVAVMQADYALLGIGAGNRATRAAHRRRGRHPVRSKPSERRRRARESLHKSLILFVFF